MPSLKGRLTTIERLANAQDDVVVILVKGGLGQGSGIARDPEGDFVARQAEDEDGEKFIERAVDEARRNHVRRLVIRCAGP